MRIPGRPIPHRLTVPNAICQGVGVESSAALACNGQVQPTADVPEGWRAACGFSASCVTESVVGGEGSWVGSGCTQSLPPAKPEA